MDDPFHLKKSFPLLDKALEVKSNVALTELVKFLARISAERDYNKALQEQNKPKKEPS